MTDEPITSQNMQANPGYAQHQIARALLTATEHADGKTRQRAQGKVARWVNVLQGMAAGSLAVGERTPVAGIPEWVTLEVVTGGFATGGLLAEGPLQDHEQQLLAQLGVRGRTNDARRVLNSYYLSDAGLAQLQEMTRSGCYALNVPEEGALLVVAWLVEQGHVDVAANILNEIGPFLDRLRFYPISTTTPQRGGSRVFLRDVRATSETLAAIVPQERIMAQREAVQVWARRYSELVALFLETVEGEVPTLDPAKSPQAAQGGWPCRRYAGNWPQHWQQRLQEWLAEFERTRKTNKLTGKPERKREHFAQLIAFARLAATDLSALKGRDVGRIRLILACYVSKYGVPGSLEHIEWLDQHRRQDGGALFADIAKLLVARLAALPPNEGLDDPATVAAPITANEAIRSRVPDETKVPKTLRRKLEFSRCDTVESLIEHKVISSAETIARVLPQITAAQRAMGLADPALRGLYAAIYRAFRRRRSLLLLNLQSQVKLTELPWITAIERFRTKSNAERLAAHQALEEVSTLAIAAFPQTIVPNKLLQELRALVQGAALNLPLVDELAADIFMGQFSGKFVAAAKQSAELLADSLYARYYDIDFEPIAKLSTPDKPQRRGWFSSEPGPDELAQLCAQRAGVPLGTWRPATNGMIIEQQQIVTTQNLAPLFSQLGLSKGLQERLPSMAQQCFEWIVRRLQMRSTKFHDRLIAVKNTAYAWRQMVFYLSLLPKSTVHACLAQSQDHLQTQSAEFQARFEPALRGLRLAVEGNTLDDVTLKRSGARRFLGWSNETHWLLAK